MANFSTKFGVGDVVYYFGETQICKARVREIEVSINQHSASIRYHLGATDVKIAKHQSVVFGTIEELVKTIPILEIRDWKVGVPLTNTYDHQ